VVEDGETPIVVERHQAADDRHDHRKNGDSPGKGNGITLQLAMAVGLIDQPQTARESARSPVHEKAENASDSEDCNKGPQHVDRSSGQDSKDLLVDEFRRCDYRMTDATQASHTACAPAYCE